MTDISVDQNLTAAERILADKAISGGYRFAPGITIHPPSKRTAENVAAMVDGMDQDALSESDVLLVMSALMGDSYEAVLEYLDEFPVEGYPELFADLFENLLILVPTQRNMEEFMDVAENRWHKARPDLFDASGGVKSKKK